MDSYDKFPTGNIFSQLNGYWSEIVTESTGRQIEFILQNLKPTGLALDLCCGDGRHSIALSKHGFKIFGLDVSKALLKSARNKAKDEIIDFPIVRADMRFVPFRNDSFSAVISMDSSFGYLPSAEEDLRSLREVHRILTKEGIFLMDVFNGDSLVDKLKKSSTLKLWKLWAKFALQLPMFSRFLRPFSWREYPSFFLLQKRTISANGDRLTESWAISNKKDRKIRVYTHIMRLYTLKEINELTRKAKLDITRIFGNYKSQCLDLNSKRLITIAKKK